MGEGIASLHFLCSCEIHNYIIQKQSLLKNKLKIKIDVNNKKYCCNVAMLWVWILWPIKHGTIDSELSTANQFWIFHTNLGLHQTWNITWPYLFTFIYIKNNIQFRVGFTPNILFWVKQTTWCHFQRHNSAAVCSGQPCDTQGSTSCCSADCSDTINCHSSCSYFCASPQNWHLQLLTQLSAPHIPQLCYLSFCWYIYQAILVLSLPLPYILPLP